jgi:hypothetical protein
VGIPVPAYDCEGTHYDAGQRVLRTLGVHQSDGHTAESQHESLKRSISHGLALLKSSPLGARMSIDERQVAARIIGFMTDHAPDAIKSGRLGKAWKITSDRQLHGGEAFAGLPISEQECLIFEQMESHLEDNQEFQDLNVDSLERIRVLAYDAVILKLGNDTFAQLYLEQQQNTDFAPHLFCGMHKDQLWVRHGATGMSLVYEKHNLPPPLELPNAFQVAASKHSARTHTDVTRGAVKLTSLCGALFNHPDGERGEQDTWKDWMENQLGYRISLPDTGNTRFGSHCDCAACLLCHRSLFLRYLEEARDVKDSGEFVNTERNVYHALQDGPTFTELAVLALFSQAISHPFMIHVRSSGMNALDQGPLYQRVQTHPATLIANPEHLVGDSACAATGSLFGESWTNPEMISCIQALYQDNKLPHLDAVLIKFLTAALALVLGTIPEFQEGGEVHLSTPCKRKRAHMDQTNDACERAIGVARHAKRRKVNESDWLRNGKMQRCWNSGRTSHARFVEKHLVNAKAHQWVRAQLRREDLSREDKHRCMVFMNARAKKAKSKSAQRAANKARVAVRVAAIARIELCTGTAASMEKLL